ncbi:RNA polymerase sigma factor [Ruminococcus flavefaciens]|jgi:RNA polymerase sigma-70 factor (ECF subfamily)|uniref:RNA polymerase sigma-70 factor, ECF subfamily n=1 Tax=Ruminococcus flavefaciens TaxID=1265 RepID=A0A1K1PDZ0_RUMFL|nr:RNA polymerase sigma factor [Ruminococcus flavefaciens]SFW45669.1 RNA polymerase sigma-70 factor, ECF subfamily [Ruminococcus flavefaciens]
MGNDAERYRRFLDGDDNGLIEIIDEYHEGMSLYLNSIVNNMCLADDIVQETFVKLAIKKPPFRGKCSFKTWLFTIARNCAVDHLRKDQKISDLSLDEHLVISDVTDTEKEYFKEEQKKELYRAMKRLNPEYYQVLYLMYFEDLDTSDIARIMHKAKRQVSDLIFRARKSLRSELERKGFIYERY